MEDDAIARALDRDGWLVRQRRCNGREEEREQRGRGEQGIGEEGVENERCLFITNYLNGSDFGGPAGRLTSKWRVC